MKRTFIKWMLATGLIASQAHAVVTEQPVGLADEVAQVLAHLKLETGIRHVYLIGTSRGTISAAHLALALQDQVDGVVLTSTLCQASRAGPGLSGFDFSAIRQPLLFVPHVADGCKTTPPQYARSLSGKYPVVWVGGQQESGGDACGPFSAHGYLGHESATVHAIAEWILQRELPPADTVAAR
jgi:pimeloyl-ACP methyl ester carboxylesterase